MMHDVFAAQESAVENKRGDQTIANRELGDSIYKLFAVYATGPFSSCEQGVSEGGEGGVGEGG
jgi:hypothetical protein